MTATAAVVDASVWVSRLLINEVHHAASQRWLRDALAAGTHLVVPTLLPVEVAAAIARRTGDEAFAWRVVQDLLRLPPLRLIIVDRQLATSAARLAVELRLRGADAVYVAAAHRLSLPLVSWDRELVARAASRISASAP